jgi:glycosyltransferase involved in cell wall biosynthesis
MRWLWANEMNVNRHVTRVAFIHPFLYRYARGIERYTVNLANALCLRGADVHILTWRWPQPIQIDASSSHVHIHVMPTARYYAAQAVVPFYTWNLVAQSYDFVWIFFAGYGEAEALALVPRQPFGIVFHYPFAQVPHRYREFHRYGLARRAAQIVSVSQFVAEGVGEHFGRASTVIHHGVDIRRFAPNPTARATIRRTLGLAPDAPLLVTAAALEDRKGVQRVLRALPHIRSEFPDVVYVVLGEGPYRPELEQLARHLQIADCVHLLGAQVDIAPFYQAADLSIILARGEASSLVALESLACGVPVVASDWRPFDELISGDDGIRVDAEDEHAVARAITALLRDPERRQTMGDRGRARILADFRWEHVAEQYLRLIRPADSVATAAASQY